MGFPCSLSPCSWPKLLIFCNVPEAAQNFSPSLVSIKCSWEPFALLFYHSISFGKFILPAGDGGSGPAAEKAGKMDVLKAEEVERGAGN